MRWRSFPLARKITDKSCQSSDVRSGDHVAWIKRSQTIDALRDPSCPECGCMMWLQILEPSEPGCDKRTFACPRCQYVEVFEVQNGPAEPAIAETG
jgi:hypothetical protein